MGFSVRLGDCLSKALRLALLTVGAGMLLPSAAWGHVGSPDVYVDGNAGPYHLFVTVRPALVIPGVAEVEVRAEGAGDISTIEIAPIPLAGEASKHPPVADAMQRSAQDKQFYTGSLWIMAPGSWQIRFIVHGGRGSGVLSVPVPATSSSTLGMQAGLGTFLGVLGVLLVGGLVGIVGAAARDAQLPAGSKALPEARRRAKFAMGVTLVLIAVAIWLGWVWWRGEANSFAESVYKPLTMQPTLTADHLLRLKIEDPGWLNSRKTDDFVLDHDHLMHLYLIREPGLELVYHLHPDQVGPGEFQLALPSVPSGTYRLYADVVHETGFPETLVSSIELPELQGRPLAGDDARGSGQPFDAAAACSAGGASTAQFDLADGYSMVWENRSTLAARTPEIFRFSLLDPKGERAPDVALYMGMLGHAAFVKGDGAVFAHVHPSGTSSMAALMMASAQNGTGAGQAEPMAGMEMTGKEMPGTAATGGHRLPNTVGFPYGFPAAGAYRIFVQMKHGATVETGFFDACASAAAVH